MFNILLRFLALIFFGFAMFWAWHDLYAQAAYAMGLAIYNQLLAQDTSNA